MFDEVDMKKRILQKAQELFLQYGYAKVTMQDIAESLGMSKKTLYNFFPSKESLVKNIITDMRADIRDRLESIWTDPEQDFVSKLKMLLEFAGKQKARFQGPFMWDLKKNAPEIWNELIEFRRNCALEKVASLYKEGIENGIFRNDIDQHLFLLLYMNILEGIMNPDTLSQLPFSGHQVFESITTILFEGILTAEGREKIISQTH